MAPSRRRFVSVTALTAAVAGCLGGESDGNDNQDGNGDDTPDGGGETAADGGEGTTATTAVDDAPEAATTTAASLPDGTVTTVSTDDHGEVLADSERMTLYVFDGDIDAEGSACTGSCAEAWPPMTTDGPIAVREGVSAPLDTIDRGDGSTQIVTGDRPLYTFSGDSEPGDTEGQGVDDSWWVVSPDGEPIEESSNSGGGGGGY